MRLVGRVASSEDARVAAGIGGTGAEKLAGRGDFVLIAGGQTIRFQAAQVRGDESARKNVSFAPTVAHAPILGRVLGGLRRVK